jgi:hypothetical protein
VVDIWNSLPEEIIVAKTVKEFEIGYSIFFSDGICFVALRCTFSICSISPDLYGDQTAAAYSRCGLTRAWNRYLKLIYLYM